VVQALVPLKDLVEAKSRLAGLLRPSERRALAQAMAEDVLGVLQASAEVSQVTLVSDDPGAGLLAQKYGANYWSESSLGCRGLNVLIECAAKRLLAGDDGPLLVLHADLPLLKTSDIREAVMAQRKNEGLVIGCDSRGRGTNLLAFDSASIPEFCFGADSCAAHFASASDAGIPVQVLRSAGIEWDLDEAQDLKYIMGQLPLKPDSMTARVLCGTELGGRVETALAIMPGNHEPVDSVNRGRAG
jgi:2-phospho-L-lactate guanylyltransferase